MWGPESSQKGVDMSPETAGDALIRSLESTGDPAAVTALIVEAGRMKDRLDKLDRVLAGEDDFWLDVIEEQSGDRLIVVVDRALAESRQLATVFRQTLAEINRRQGGEDSGRREDDDGAPAWV